MQNAAIFKHDTITQRDNPAAEQTIYLRGTPGECRAFSAFVAEARAFAQAVADSAFLEPQGDNTDCQHLVGTAKMRADMLEQLADCVQEFTERAEIAEDREHGSDVAIIFDRDEAGQFQDSIIKAVEMLSRSGAIFECLTQALHNDMEMFTTGGATAICDLAASSVFDLIEHEKGRLTALSKRLAKAR